MKIRSRWLSKLAAWALVSGFKTLFSTCRMVHVATENRLKLNHPEAATHPECFILCAWHDVLLIPTFASSRRLRERTCCLVSKHQDGSYLADSMTLLRYSTVRGSSSRGGAEAIKKLLDDTAGKHIVITPDGPRGPRRELKVGAVYLASQTGRRICPAAYSCRSGWRIRGSWTDMLIPKPFTTVYLLTGEPIEVPENLSREQLHEYVQKVQTEMDRLHIAVEAMAAGSIPAEPPSREQKLAA